jgi:phenylalanine-4-hydroxylase
MTRPEIEPVTTPAGQPDLMRSAAEQLANTRLRGDYALADAQYVVAQNWSGYTPAQHALWRKLYQRQAKLVPGRACETFLDRLGKLEAAQGIPQFERTSDVLFKATGWQLVAVPGLVPDRIFFEHLAHRRFPVTVWLREPHEYGYIVEPDVFHDFFGHVPLLFNPVFADHLQEYGKGGLKALKLGGLEFLARLYWYTMEFGLVQSPQGLRAYGAGLLSSGGEIEFCLTSRQPRRIRFDAERVMRTLYKIDSYQEIYFVIEDFDQLLHDTAPDFTPVYQRLKTLEPLTAQSILAGETNLPVA